MRINQLTKTIIITDSIFYSNNVLRPFIDAFLIRPELVKNDPRCKLFGKYKFGEYELNELAKHSTYSSKRFYLFIGYRFLHRRYRPFFLSITEHEKSEYEITGYTTICDGDLDRPYYQEWVKLPDIKQTDIKLTILSNDWSRYPTKLEHPIKKMKANPGNSIPLLQSLSDISKKTKKRNEVLKKIIK